MEKQRRTTSIELLRFVAAIGVMMVHFGGIYLSKGNYEPVTFLFQTFADVPLEAKRSYAPFAFVFVEFFFMLGGFFMVKYLDGRKDPLNPGGFILKKVKSFYPIFIVAFSAQMIFYVVLNDFKGVSGFFDALFHFKWEALLLHCTGFLKDPAFNLDYLLGQDWYLSALILGLIVIYPIALYYRNFFEKIFVPWSTIILYALLIQQYGTLDVGSEYLGIVSTAIIRGVAGISAGCLAYVVYRSMKEKALTPTQLKVLAGVEVILWLAIPVLFTSNIIATDADALFYVPIFMVIIVLAFLDKTPLSGFFNSHCTGLLGYLGSLSLYLYLFHWTVMTAMNYFMPQLSPLLATGIYMGTTIGLSAIMFEVNKRRKTALPIIIIVVVFLSTALVTAMMA
ncbi:acyltransferase family protein [Eubacterium barkeri]|uniref:Peptidoglycan/LPS O-acetylase OafA/YrhL, contains acyltransferase and SGNH-hydrolase domains n=1 Tax=Eubacterium barkeri TaxID=1528 RepID=A0A1H3GUP2_EUBBA|nr:acyltransferase family protein [Eubacterium barkeri]SDY06204.1 Peptidoglycan/LPS O-acetylase OafA/YrhL, contains acyltransferase and SGNH-hydrolase domains [Eubacterium barkeri]